MITVVQSDVVENATVTNALLVRTNFDLDCRSTTDAKTAAASP